MKKFLIIALSLVSIFTFSLGLTACGEPETPEHSHSFEKEIVSSAFLKSEATCLKKATYFKSCECGEKGEDTFESGELASHVYENGKCKWCEEEEPHVHSFVKEVATADYLKTEADCENKAVYFKSCECGEKGTATFESGDKLGHDYGDFITNNDGTHGRVCKRNAMHVETKNCSGGTATCSAKAICKDCGTEYGKLKNHTYSSDWSKDATHHYKEANCGCELEPKDKAEHDMVNGKCSICFYIEQYDLDPNFTPEVRFVVTSDVHMRTNGAFDSQNQLDKLINTAYDFADSQSDYDNLDGMFFVGDNTQNGASSEAQLFYGTLNKKIRPETEARTCMGNHEYYSTGHYSQSSMQKAPGEFLKHTGYDSVDYHKTINGYHVIMLSLDYYGTSTKFGEGGANVYFSQAKLDWLEKQIKIAEDDDPTGKKPILVMQHIAPSCGVLGSSNTSYDKKLDALLEKHPNVVDFSGHTHRPVSDPRSIWQGEYTAIQTGTLAYLGMGKFADNMASGGNLADVYGNYDTEIEESGLRTGYMYYIIEIDKNNVMKVIVYDMYNNEVYSQTLLDSFGDPAGFDYTSDRKEYTDSEFKPEFEKNTEVLLNNNYRLVQVTIPQAKCKTTIQSYRLELHEKNSRTGKYTLSKAEHRFSGFTWGSSMPDYVHFTVPNLTQNTEYKLFIYAISCFGQESQPIEMTLKTSSVITSNDFAPDIFSLKYQDGKIINAVNGDELKSIGAPTASQEQFSFNGSSAYTYDRMYPFYRSIAKGVTVEAYFSVNQRNTSKNQSIIGNMEDGGFGLIYDTSGKIKFGLYSVGNTTTYKTGGTYTYATNTTATPTNQYVHAVGVFDGSNVHLYINGNLVSSKPVSKAFCFPNWTAQALVIGGDPAGYYSTSNYAKCDIKVANIYSHAMTADQVLAKYSALAN